MPEHYSDDFITEVLRDVDTIAVVGASLKSDRPSHRVTKFLLDHGYDVIPVNPKYDGELVFGDRVFVSSLEEIDKPIDMVDIFRASNEAGEAVDAAIAHGAKAVWMQEGVIDEAAAERARAKGLKVVMDRCPAKEIPRLGLKHLKRPDR